MIEAKNITKRYGDKEAVKDLSFRVERGEVLGLLGPNGAGKTTMMRILTCYMPASSGSASIAGFDVFEQPLEVKKRIGYLPEIPPLYKELTVEGYLKFVCGIKDVPAKSTLKQVDAACAKAGLTDVRKRLVGNLSKGFRQRVGVAQALIHEPEVLILDEPTIGLDPRQIIEMRGLIKGLGGEHTVIISSHILQEVSATCGRVVIINEGQKVAEDTPAELARHVAGDQRMLARIKGPAGKVQKKLGAIKGVNGVELMEQDEKTVVFSINCSGVEVIADQLVSTLKANKWSLYELKPASLSLEDVFLKLTGK